MPKAKLRVATATFACQVKDAEYFVAREVLPADHPAVKGREELFRPEDPMEQATAALGEKRKR